MHHRFFDSVKGVQLLTHPLIRRCIRNNFTITVKNTVTNSVTIHFLFSRITTCGTNIAYWGGIS